MDNNSIIPLELEIKLKEYLTHNKVNICNQDPDSTGNVTVSIEHLTDTSISSLTNN